MDTIICMFKEETEINSKMCLVQWSALADYKIQMDKLVANSTRTKYCKSYLKKMSVNNSQMNHFHAH